MKKVVFTLSAILLAAASVFAGGDKTSKRYLSSDLSKNWFIDASGTLNAWQGRDRSSLVDFSTMYFKNTSDKMNFGTSLKVGKYITPGVGLRVALDLNQATNNFGDFVLETLHADILFSVIDIFGEYREDRLYRPVLFTGYGSASHADKFFQTKDLNREACMVFGLSNHFRITKDLDIHFDIQTTAARWSIESIIPQEWDERRVHFNLSAGLGLTWNIGGRQFETCPEAVIEDCSKQDAKIKALEAEVVALRNRPVEVRPSDTVVKIINMVEGEQLMSTPFSIFFKKGSYELTSAYDIVNLAEIAKSSQDNNYRIRLRGTCDDKTGSEETNLILAENRCRRIMEELVKLGISEKNIVINAAGGVSELADPELDRRVFVELIK